GPTPWCRPRSTPSRRSSAESAGRSRALPRRRVLLRGRKEKDVCDRLRAGEEHQEAVESDRDAPRFADAIESGEEFLVEWEDFAAKAAALLLLLDQTAALLPGVAELGESVRQLEPGRVQLEALRDARIRRLEPRERRLRRRVFDEIGRALDPQRRLDLLHEDLREHVVPGGAGGRAHAAGAGSLRERLGVEGQRVEARVPREGIAAGDPLEGRTKRNRIGAAAVPLARGRLRRAGEENLFQIGHDRVRAAGGGIELEQRELG